MRWMGPAAAATLFVLALAVIPLALRHGENDDQGGNAKGAQVPTPASATRNALVEQPACQRGQTRDDEALCYEVRSAEASERQAAWAEGQFWVGLAGVIAVVATLNYTARATKAAEGAAKDAAESIAASRLSAEATGRAAEAAQTHAGIAANAVEIELRPYMALDEAVILNVTPGVAPSVLYLIKNQGRTPAIEVINGAFIDYCEFHSLPPTRPRTEEYPSRSVVAQGSGLTSTVALARPLSEQEIQTLREGTHAIFFWGFIEYVDVFGKQRGTKFATFHNRRSGIVGESKALTTYREGNEVT